MSVEQSTSLPNISLASRCLPPPTDIRIEFPKIQGQCMITWNKLQGADHPVFYNVYRGISFNGIFHKLNKLPLNGNKYLDYTRGNNPNIIYWYKVSSLYQDNGQWVEGPLSESVQYQRNSPNLFWFNKINERNMWMLKNDGMYFDFYSRKYEGKHCRCYDETRGRASQGDCPICYGTGFVGGYEPQCQLLVRLVNVEESLNISREFYQWNSSPSAWTITSLPIHNRDLLISPDGKFYHILSVVVHQANGFLFHHDLRLKYIEPQDPIYSMKRIQLKPAY